MSHGLEDVQLVVRRDDSEETPAVAGSSQRRPGNLVSMSRSLFFSDGVYARLSLCQFPAEHFVGGGGGGPGKVNAPGAGGISSSIESMINRLMSARVCQNCGDFLSVCCPSRPVSFGTCTFFARYLATHRVHCREKKKNQKNQYIWAIATKMTTCSPAMSAREPSGLHARQLYVVGSSRKRTFLSMMSVG